MAHYISISGGKISITRDSHARTPILFDRDEDAADFLALAIMETRQEDCNVSSSVDFPADEGRPGFDFTTFWALMTEKLREGGVEVGQ